MNDYIDCEASTHIDEVDSSNIIYVENDSGASVRVMFSIEANKTMPKIILNNLIDTFERRMTSMQNQ